MKKIRLTLYPRGSAVVHWPIQGRPSKNPTPRGRIGSQSKKSRLRCAHAFSEAEKDWGAMATLSFRVQPATPKRALKKFARKFKEAAGEIQWAWVMEWQTRGVIHFHLFFERDWIESVGYWTETFVRRGVETHVIRGPIDEWITETWIECVGDRDPAFLSFQRGGIVELLRSADAAGRYVAREAGKRVQKQLPEGVEAAGRWWWLNPKFKGKPCGFEDIEVWPYEKAYHHVFSVADLKAATFKEKRLNVTRAARSGELQ